MTPPRTVIVYGDSITQGLELPEADRPAMWVRVVESNSAGRLRLLNEGRGGRPTAALDEFEQVLSSHPVADLLVLAVGGADAARDLTPRCVPNALANLRAMTLRARETYNPELPVLLVAPTNIRRDTLGKTRPIGAEREKNLRGLHAALPEFSREIGCEWISLHGLLSHGSLALDGVHPDPSGHAAIARVMLPKLLTMISAR